MSPTSSSSGPKAPMNSSHAQIHLRTLLGISLEGSEAQQSWEEDRLRRLVLAEAALDDAQGCGDLPRATRRRAIKTGIQNVLGWEQDTVSAVMGQIRYMNNLNVGPSADGTLENPAMHDVKPAAPVTPARTRKAAQGGLPRAPKRSRLTDARRLQPKSSLAHFVYQHEVKLRVVVRTIRKHQLLAKHHQRLAKGPQKQRATLLQTLRKLRRKLKSETEGIKVAQVVPEREKYDSLGPAAGWMLCGG